uniref:probable LRR receptor-like serine/threonine-protein kinase At1g07650 isoform X2 n=1 Tax=Erigeron canadensis TaxID=72917 RepID=UPI001CB94D99|nr:probable LRR receptor-like serine/threonine-protein kinase At1g07650 isoform X2 [Erigeron canadensis]
MMCYPVLRLLFVLTLIISIFVFFQVNGIQEQVGTLLQDQVSGVSENANELKNEDLSFSTKTGHTPSAGKPRRINIKVHDIQTQVGQIPPNEVSALKEIAKQLGKVDWEFNLNPCDDRSPQFKNSVVCDCSADGVCHVIKISLKGQDLKGVLPISLANLPSLKHIDLSYNYLNGTLPTEWASTRLEFLSVTGNRLSGSIPSSFGKITTLRYLQLENNMFSGKVPAELGNLTNVTNLVLSANNLSGELPMELNSLTNLIELRLSSNNFSGKIPNLGDCTKIRILEIQGSGVEGPIPASLSLLRDLYELRISDLSGEGSQFPDLSSMKNITKLMLRSCNISGSIPGYISQMSNLELLDLSFNNLGGEIPDLSGVNNLRLMFLSGNSLNGSVPGWIKDNGDKKRYVDLSYNKLNEESIPTLCDHESLNLFRSYNGINSDLAKCLKSCSKEYYSVNINCGGKRALIGKKYYEEDLDLAGPAHFEPLIREHWGFSNTGSIKWDSDDTEKFTVTTTSSMNDSQLYATARHSPLSLTYYGRCLANGNYTLTLHFAEIVFTDNQSYKGLGRRIFDVYVQGELKVKNFDIKYDAGGSNKKVTKTLNVTVTNKTLEIRLQYAGKGTTAVPVRGLYGPLISAISMDDFNPPSHGHHKTITFIAIGGVAVALCLTLTIIGIAWKWGYIWNQTSKERDLKGMDLHIGIFTYSQIKAATNNFADSNKLGEGGFGSVYRGALLDGTLIAVKQLSSKSAQGNREFVNEIGMIAGIQHPNIVRLHGCCVEGNHRLLVYEYMENNSLAQALFEHDKSNKMEINWASRYRICVGIAKGLTFLHEETALRMVHRDIKATNILLDTYLNPKISDFGLAKLNDEENSHISTRIAGTMGYIAPEYALWGYLTYKADVYSFGVLLLEIVAGKHNMKYRPNEEFFCLLDWAIVLQERGSFIDFVDPRLGSHFNKREVDRIMKVALQCTNQSPTLRPNMSEVLNMIEGRTKIKGTEMNVVASEDELKFQALKGKVEEIQLSVEDSFNHQSSTSSHDLYTNSKISEESSMRPE